MDREWSVTGVESAVLVVLREVAQGCQGVVAVDRLPGLPGLGKQSFAHPGFDSVRTVGYRVVTVAGYCCGTPINCGGKQGWPHVL